MKGKICFKFAMPAVFLLIACVHGQTGSDYDLSWSTIDGGGGTNSGSNYVLSGTIGQPDAAAMSGSIYSLRGGFWFHPICIVGFDDLSYFTDYWLHTGTGLPADFSGSDDEVNLIDYSYLTSYWMDYCPSGWPW